VSFTRRAFVIGGSLAGGGMVVGVTTIGAWMSSYDRRSVQAEHLPEGGAKLVAQWIRIAADNTVTVLTPHVEMGQGSQTGTLQIVLDELDADPTHTHIELAPARSGFTIGDVMVGFIAPESEGFSRRVLEKSFGRLADLNSWQFTGGSTAIRFTGWRGIRHGAAAARQMLLQAAAERLGVPSDALQTHDSHVIWNDQRIPYGALADAASKLPTPVQPVLKTPEQWRYIGRPHPRIDLPDKVFARAEYGIDRVVPGMRYAAVVPPTLAEGTITGVTNTAEVSAMRGVERVLNLGSVVAVVADKPWRAERAVRAVQMEVTPREEPLYDSDVLRPVRGEILQIGELFVAASRGEGAKEAIGGGERVIGAEYTLPFLAHAPMEPMNATIWEDGGKVHIATGTQDPFATRTQTAAVLGRPVDAVVVHPHTLGGGFGRRAGASGASFNWVRIAAQLQKEAGGALQMLWSREAGLAMSSYRPADHAWLRATLGPDGRPTAWWARHHAPISTAQDALPPYDIPHVTVEHTRLEPALPFAFWRSVDASIQGFTIESFVDELAIAAGEDPLAYRLSLVDSQSRYARLLSRVADLSGWGGAQPEGMALGVALNECFGSIVAQVAQVSLEDGRTRVHRVWAAVDPGLAINPDSVKAQVEGGIHFGLSAALYGQITIRQGAIEQTNFHNYPVVRMADAPRVEVVIQQTPGATVGGVGEVGTPGAAPAVANALAQLTQRPRTLPIAPS